MRKSFEVYKVDRRYPLYLAVIVNDDEVYFMTFGCSPCRVSRHDFVFDELVYNDFWDYMIKSPESMYFKGDVNICLVMIKAYYPVLNVVCRYDL